MSRFPVIKTLADVLPAIEGHDEIIVADRGTHTVVNYVVVKEDTFPPLNVAGGSAKMRAERTLHHQIRRECRGLIFDKEGRIIRRPLHKFFNINEREETLARNVDLSRPHVILEKLDGSSISPFAINTMRHDVKIIYGTRMGETEIGDQAGDFAAMNPEYGRLFTYCYLHQKTPIFEWCSRQQRIVIDHPEDRLVLLAIRDNITGEYVSYEKLKTFEQEFGIPVVGVVGVAHNGSTDNLVDIVRALPMDQYGEGIVIRFEDDGEMMKLKLDDYCVIHRAKERILEERYVVEDIINGDIDDVMATVLEDDRKNIERYRGQFWEAFGEYQAKLMERIKTRHKQYPNRKDYALSPENKLDSKFTSRAIFWFYEEPLMLPVLRQYILDNRIRPALGTRVKFGEMKNEVIPNIRFQY